jgi:hypothetical protein
MGRTKKEKGRKSAAPRPGPSDRTLIFDIETTTDAAQQLRFGGFQTYKGNRLGRKGIFYDPDSLDSAELRTLQQFATTQGYQLMTVALFVENFFYKYVRANALVVGFNLPFDLSRLAIWHGAARRRMLGGFSYVLSENSFRPRVRTKHLNSRASIIDLAAESPKGVHKAPVWPGYFLDLKTLAGALLGGSWSLGSLAENLGTKHPKSATEEHGEQLSSEYLEYALRDVQVTWECYQKLRDRYQGYRLTKTQPTSIYSEAGLGKAYLKQMGIRP